MSTIQKVEFINKKEIIATILNKNTKIFIIYIIALSVLVIQVYSFCQAQIILLLAEKTIIKIPSKWLNYANIFLFNFAIELFKNTYINKYAMKLIKNI